MSLTMPIPCDQSPVFKNIDTLAHVNCQQSVFELIDECVFSGEGKLSEQGALVIQTGRFTGRSPKDKYIVKDEITTTRVDWNDFNHPLDEFFFNSIRGQIEAYLSVKSDLWVRHCSACADKDYRLKLRIVC